MKRKAIESWLSGVLSQQNSTPPSTPPDIIDGGRQTKRRNISQRGKSTSRKRGITDTASSLTDLTDHTSFDPSVQSSSGTSRQRTTARDLLNELPLSSPSIYCTRPKSGPLPRSVISLRQALGHNLGFGVIPAPLKVT